MKKTQMVSVGIAFVLAITFISHAQTTTNLWIRLNGIASNNLVGIISNTIPDIYFEVQSKSDLIHDTQWVSTGFGVYGSELTNWTSLVLTNLSRTNKAFFRIRSWVDDGSGLPIWWQMQYFGTTGVDPYGNPAGDGWSNLQKFQNGMNPNVFYTPPAPQGVTVSYNTASGMATVSWLPSPGAVTNYTVNFNGTDYNVAAGVNSLTAAISLTPWDIVDDGPSVYTDFQVQGNYAGGSSSPGSTSLATDYPDEVRVVPGPQGSSYLVASPSTLPPGTTTIRLTRVDDWAEGWYGDPSFDTHWDIPVSSLTNGLYLIPAFMQATPTDSYGAAWYDWWLETVGANGIANSWANPASGYNDTGLAEWFEPPFYDGRVQLKQNLIFLLRQPNENSSFEIGEIANAESGSVFYTTPANYVYAGFYDWWSYYPDYSPFWLNALWPFQENYLYRNFVFATTNVDVNGALTTGIGADNIDEADQLTFLPTFLYQSSPTNGATIPAVLATNQTRWLCSYPLNLTVGNTVNLIGFSSQSGNPPTWTFTSGARNYWGLPYLTAKLAYDNNGNLATTTLSPGNSTQIGANVYMEAAQPQFQTMEYDFWNSSPVPGSADFSTTNKSDLMITAVGNPYFGVNCYAKLAITNGYPGVFAYLGQYFDQAYQIDVNGNVTTNTTGILSPYGYFFPTIPGSAALVTMPDLDTGERGTGVVWCASMAVNKSVSGNMDLSFNGPDATSQASPMVWWVNNDHDFAVNGNDPGKDVQCTTNTCDYSDDSIGSQRDLEDFARLWICGIPALWASNGYQVTLSWNVSSGNPAVNLFRSVETNGGAGYLTNTNIAAAQVDLSNWPFPVLPNSPGIRFAKVTPDHMFTFPANFFTNNANKYFLFEGAGIGSGELLLTISQNGNTIAQTGVWLDLHDVKDFYEQAEITNSMSGAISNWTSGVEIVQLATASALGDDTNLIVLVHGINVSPVDWLIESDTVFKRLYWAGYHGKFMTVKWPCNFLTPPQPVTLDVFNLSEAKAYKSSTALTTYLNQLRSRFPGCRLNLLVHSQGNAVASEAIKNGAPFDSYILTQGAIPDSAYDVAASTYADFVAQEVGIRITPEWQPMGYRGIYTNLTGHIVNFYNPNDGVLAIWQEDQIDDKPSGYYSYDGTNCWYVDFFFIKHLVSDPQEARSMISRARTLSIGQSGPASAHGVIQSAVDLNVQFGFNSDVAEHSAQWTRPIQTSRPYYLQILNSIAP